MLSEEQVAQSASWSRIKADAEADGARVAFVVGKIEVYNRGTGAFDTVEGVHKVDAHGQTTYVIRVDGLKRNAEQIYRHEKFHELVSANPGLMVDLMDALDAQYSQQEIVAMVNSYVEAYHGIYGVFDASMTEDEQNALILQYMNEVFADAYAKIQRGARRIDAARKVLSDQTDAAQRAEQNRKAMRNKTAPPRQEYMFAGERARTADLEALDEAKQMLESDADMEEIRMQTGWHKGKDGRWRFEIDDSTMEYRRDGDARLMEEERYRRLQELSDKWAMSAEGGAELSESETAEMESLQEEYSDRVWDEKFLLRDFIRHDSLFEAYPRLRSVSLAFDSLGYGENGYFSRRSNTIVLSDKLLGSPESTLIHEIQHIIQRYEDFASGASVGYWNQRMEDGYSKRWSSGEEMMPSELYRNTAGEIEARDSASRRRMTHDERKKTSPNYGDENTVFAENSAVAQDFVGWTVERNEVYITKPDVMALTMSERIKKFKDNFIKDFNGRRIKFERNGHIHYARFGDSQSEIGKFVYEGKSKSSASGYRAKVRLLAEGSMYKLVEDANYKETKKETGKKAKAHKDARFWDYLLKTIVVDGKAYDVTINVRLDVPNGDYSQKEEYIYSILFRDNKRVATSVVSPASSKVLGKLDVTTNDNLPQNELNVKEFSFDDSRSALEDRVSGDDYLNALDLIEEIQSVGAQVDDAGYVTLYHRTSNAAAKAIYKTGVMSAKEDGLFFSTNANGENNYGYGDAVVELKVPAEMLVLDDIFADEASVRIPLENSRRMNVSEYLVREKETETQEFSFDDDVAELDVRYGALADEGDGKRAAAGERRGVEAVSAMEQERAEEKRKRAEYYARRMDKQRIDSLVAEENAKARHDEAYHKLAVEKKKRIANEASIDALKGRVKSSETEIQKYRITKDSLRKTGQLTREMREQMDNRIKLIRETLQIDRAALKAKQKIKEQSEKKKREKKQEEEIQGIRARTAQKEIKTDFLNLFSANVGWSNAPT